MTTATRILLALLVGLSIAACDDASLTRDGRPDSLAGTAWRVLSVNDRAPVAGSEPTAIFTAAKVNGSAGCNSYGGSYTYDPSTGAISFPELGMTAMGCLQPGRNEFETLFSQAIGSVTTASVDEEGRLVLTGPGAQILLVVDGVGT